MKKTLILLMLCCFCAVLAQGLFEEAVESESEEPGKEKLFSLNGYVRGVYYGGKIPEEMAGETKYAYGDAALKIDINKTDLGKAFAELRYTGGYGGDEGFSTFDIREAYVGVFPGPFDFYIGKQIIAWGRADAHNPTNVITPQKYISRSPFEDDRRDGNFLIRSQLNVEPVRVEALWIPVYAANELPIDQGMITTLLMEQLSSLPFGVNLHELTEKYPDASFKESGFAVRCNLELPAVDGSVSYFNGYNPMPGIDILVGGTGMVMEIMPSLKAYRMHMVGGDFATTLGSFIGLRGEVAFRNYFECYKKNAYIPYPDLQYVVGIDKMIKDFSFILQYAGMFVFDFEELEKSSNPLDMLDYELELKNRLINRQTDQVSHSIVFRPGLSLLHETLTLEIVGMWSISTEELLLRPKISYQVTDAVTATLGGELYVGADETMFDLIEEEVSAGFVELKVSF